VSAFVVVRVLVTGWGQCSSLEVVVVQGGGGCSDVEIVLASKQ